MTPPNGGVFCVATATFTLPGRAVYEIRVSMYSNAFCYRIKIESDVFTCYRLLPHVPLGQKGNPN